MQNNKMVVNPIIDWTHHDVWEYNLVDVISQKDGEPMDDVIDAHVTDGTLFRELDRLWDGENLTDVKQEFP